MTTAALPGIDEITDSFQFLEDWDDRFSYVLDLGKRIPLAAWVVRVMSSGQTPDPSSAEAYLTDQTAVDPADRKMWTRLFSEANRVHGCQSTVWLHMDLPREGRPQDNGGQPRLRPQTPSLAQARREKAADEEGEAGDARSASSMQPDEAQPTLQQGDARGGLWTEPMIEIYAVSDAHLVNGLIAILLSLYNGKTPQQVLDTDAESVVRGLGLEEHLSPTRRNGLHAMIKRIRQLAGEQG